MESNSILLSPKIEEVRKILREKIHIDRETSEEMSAYVRRQEALVDSMLNMYKLYDDGVPFRPMLMGKTLPEILNSNQPIAARHGYAREEIVVAREDFGIYRHYECADCYGLPNIGMKICAYEAGTAAGCFARPLGRPVEVVETKCCANGDPYCEFEVHVG